MTEQQQATLHAALLAIDDPYYLNTFQAAEDEAEWWRLNEQFIQRDIKRFLPAAFNPQDPEIWRFIRINLGQFFED